MMRKNYGNSTVYRQMNLSLFAAFRQYIVLYFGFINKLFPNLMTTLDKEINFRTSRKINLLVQSASSFISFNVHWCLTNPNCKKSYKISPRLISKTRCMWCCAIALAYIHGKAYLSKQLQWRAAGDPRLARGRSWVRALATAPRERFFLHPPSLPGMLPQSLILNFFPIQKSVGLYPAHYGISILQDSSE